MMPLDCPGLSHVMTAYVLLTTVYVELETTPRICTQQGHKNITQTGFTWTRVCVGGLGGGSDV